MGAPLSSSQADHWLAMIYDGVLSTPPWAQLLEALRQALKANYVSLAIRPPSPDDPGLVVFAGVKVAATQFLYERSLYPLDPFVDLPVDQVLVLHERISDQQWLDSVLYRDFLSALNIGQVMGADLLHDEHISRLRITRPRKAKPFTESDKALCQTLLSHLKRALTLYDALTQVDTERKLYASTLHSLSIGTLLLDARGMVLQCSDVAAHLLAGEHGLSLQQGRLQARLGVDDKRLKNALNRVLSARAEARSVLEAVALGWPGKGLGVLLRGVVASGESPHQAAVEVVLRDPEHPPEPSEVLLRQLFLLTPAEALLAVQLCHGHTLEQAAQTLSISRNTARAHLRMIFSKTGVARQATLVRLLQSSVAALNPL